MEGDLVSFSPGAVREELQSTVGDRRLDGDWMETGTGLETGDWTGTGGRERVEVELICRPHRVTVHRSLLP
jgi:hypothetical protein